MDLNPTQDQRQLVDAFAALYGKHASGAAVRAAEPSGFDASLWSALTEIGAVSMGVPRESGGGGASLLDLALVAEQHGRFVAPAPLVEAQVAARLIARLAEKAAGLLESVVSDDRLITVALHPVREGVANSVATLVPAAAVADQALVPVGGDLMCVELSGHRLPVSTGAATPVADVVDLRTGSTVLAGGPDAERNWAHAVDEWMTLTACVLVGLARRALDTAVAYVKERTVFGRAIGSFQGVAHPLADAATAVDGARLLAYRAAWAAQEEPERFAELAAMCFAFATETARQVTALDVHVHGGYGVSTEYDAQLYFRRAQGWPALLAEPRVVRQWAYQRRLARAEA